MPWESEGRVRCLASPARREDICATRESVKAIKRLSSLSWVTILGLFLGLQVVLVSPEEPLASVACWLGEAGAWEFRVALRWSTRSCC